MVLFAFLAGGVMACGESQDGDPFNLGDISEPRLSGLLTDRQPRVLPTTQAPDEATQARHERLVSAQASTDSRFAPVQVGDELSAHNSAQGFDIVYGQDGATLHWPGSVSLFDARPPLAIGWTGIGRAGRHGLESVDILVATPRVEATTVVYERAAGREWYSNGPLGLEQGFELNERPKGDGVLVLRVTFKGLTPVLDKSTREVRFFDHGRATTLRYRDLFGLDADGSFLPTAMDVDGNHVYLLIDDSTALYPLHIDPTLTQVVDVSSSDAASDDLFGLGLPEKPLMGAPHEDDLGMDRDTGSRQGASCTIAAQCATGYCAQGVCCDVTCDRPCERCNSSSLRGTCTKFDFNHVCRMGSPDGECDPAERCDGSSGECPPDVWYADGTTCGGGWLVCRDRTCCRDDDCPYPPPHGTRPAPRAEDDGDGGDCHATGKASNEQYPTGGAALLALALALLRHRRHHVAAPAQAASDSCSRPVDPKMP